MKNLEPYPWCYGRLAFWQAGRQSDGRLLKIFKIVRFFIEFNEGTYSVIIVLPIYLRHVLEALDAMFFHADP